MSVRVVATADSHLGQYVAKMPLRTLELRRQRLRRALGAVFDGAIARQAHLLILAGDVFDSPTPRNPERIYLARRLADLRRQGICAVAIGGNHDTPRSSSEEGGHLALRIYAELEALEFFGYLQDDLLVQPHTFQADGLTVAVGGFTPQPNLPEDVDPLADVTFAPTSADLRTLVVHGIIEGTMPPGIAEPIIKRETIARLSGSVDLLIAGDVHAADTFRCGSVTVVIPGATEHLEFGAASSPGYAWIEADRSGIAVRHEQLTPQPRLSLGIRSTDLDPADPTGTIVELVDASADPEAIARLSIEGVLSREVYRGLNPVIIEERGRSSFFAFELDLSRLSVRLELARDLLWTPRRTMADEVRAVVDYQLAVTEDEEERAILANAREELLSALALEGEEVAR